MAASKFAVIVTIDLFPGQIDEFMPVLMENAAATVKLEPDCSRFDVLVPTNADQVVLYEIYASEAAFAFHMTTPHFQLFDTATQAMVQGKNVLKLSLQARAGV